MRVRSIIELNKGRRLHGGYFAMTALFLASSVLGGVSTIINAQAEEDQSSNSGVTGTLIPQALQWKAGSKGSLFEPTNIVITGATLLPFSRLEPLYAHLKDAPFKIRDIQGVMRQIARLYKQEGFYGIEIQLDLAQLENDIVAINIEEPADLKGDIIAQSRGKELKTPKLPMVKVTPKKIEKPKKKKVVSPREPIIKKAMKALKTPPKTRLEQRIAPDNKNAKEIKPKIYLLPDEGAVGKIRLLGKAKALDPVPEAPKLLQENIDPPPTRDITLPENNDEMSVYTPAGIDNKKKSGTEKESIKIGSYISTGKPIKPVRKREVIDHVAPVQIAHKPKKKKIEPIYTRTSFIDVNTPDREDLVFVERDEEDLLILEMQVNNHVRNSGIVSYMDDGDLLVPLFSFVEAMGFPIDIKPGAGLARGWFLNEENTFQLRTMDSDITIAGKQLKYPTGHVEVHMDDIYVHRQSLEEWFGVSIAMEMSSLSMFVNIDTQLPYEDQMERRDIWDRVVESREGSVQASDNVPFVNLPYKIATLPSIKTTYDYSYNKTSGGDTLDSTSGSLQAEGDLFYMTGNLSANINKSQDQSVEVRNINLTLRRLDEDGNLPLGATRIDAGDINLPSLPLVGGSSSGRGILFNKKPKGYISNPDDFSITGLAPIGWDVELYHNQNLVDFQTVDNSGEYNFSSLLLNKGNNIFKVVIYGVDGEKRELTEHYYVGPGILNEGDFAYEFAAIESSQKILPFLDTGGIEDKRPAFMLSGEYGVNKNLSFTGGAYHGPLLEESEPESAVTAGVRASVFNNIYLKTDIASQSKGGEAGSLEAQWIRPNKIFSAGTKRYWSFLSAEKDNLNRSFMRWDHTMYPTSLSPFNYSIGYSKDTYINAPSVNKITTKISTKFFGFAFNNQFNSEKVKGQDESLLRGTFTTSHSVAGTQLRGRMTYDPRAHDIVQNLSISGQRSINPDVILKGNINKTFTDDDDYIAGSAELRVALDKMTVGLSAGANEEGDLNAGISLSSNILPVINDNGGYSYESYGNKSGFNVARLNVRTFLDRDGNEIYSEGDDLLERVQLNDERRGNRSTTNSKGIATLKNLIPFTNTNISVDVTTLPDIYYVPVTSRVKINPRPGLAGLIDFPITVNGEVTGMVYMNGKVNTVNLDRALVELMDMNGNRIQQTYTEQDGFFIMGDIPVGKYMVKIIPTHRVIPVTPSVPIEITFDEPVLDDLEFYAETTNIDIYN